MLRGVLHLRDWICDLFPSNIDWNWLPRKEENNWTIVPPTPLAIPEGYSSWYFLMPLRDKGELEWMYHLHPGSIKSHQQVPPVLSLIYPGLKVHWNESRLSISFKILCSCHSITCSITFANDCPTGMGPVMTTWGRGIPSPSSRLVWSPNLSKSPKPHEPILWSSPKLL